MVADIIITPPATEPRANRLHVRHHVEKDAKGAVWQAIQALSVAAAMAQGVPYLGAISTALTVFMKMQDDVDICRDEWKMAIGYARQINTVIERFRGDCESSGRGDGLFTADLRAAFEDLEVIVLDSIEALSECRVNSKKFFDRIRLYYRRSELGKVVKDCAARMHQALQLFNTTLQINQALLLQDIRFTVSELQGTTENPHSFHAAAPVHVSGWRLRAAPSIFHGRTLEVARAVELILRQAPAHLAVLGPGGIGKTSIALSVLHDPQVNALYANNRCFMSCEAITTADGIVRALAECVGLVLEQSTSSASNQDSLMLYLKTMSGIICIDNMETPLDCDKSAVEVLLEDISALPSIALLVTSRDTSVPTIKWTSPPLQHIKPFSLEAALRTWNDICHGHDEDSLKLIRAVDCMPLAVNILARLAAVEKGSKNIWARWESERTDLIQAGRQGHRLYNIAVSIELSLRTLGSPSVMDVLSFICIFPSGLNKFDMDILAETTQITLPFRRALSLLKQYSLVYEEDSYSVIEWFANPVVRVLSPIRHYMLQHHRISDEIFLSIVDAIPKLYMTTMGVYVEEGFRRGEPCHRHCLDIIAGSVRILTDVETAHRAIEVAIKIEYDAPSLASIYLQFSEIWERRGEFEEARFYFAQGIRLLEDTDDWATLYTSYSDFTYLFRNESRKHPLEPRHLDEVQEVLDKTWRLIDRWQIPWLSTNARTYDPRPIQSWLDYERERLQLSQDTTILEGLGST